MGEKERLKNRFTLNKVLESKATIERIEYVHEILSSLSSIICIISEKNQVVFANDLLLENYNLDLEKDIIGQRPGEFLECENAINDTGGCGTTDKCEYCGAFNAIKVAWKEKRKISRECKIITQKEGNKQQLDIEITATPMSFEEGYLIISIIDISEKKQKELLERIFFHDILNIAGSLSGILQIFPSLSNEEKEEYLSVMASLNDQIIDEIKAQRQMMQAEMGELSVEIQEIEIDSLLENTFNKIRFHQVSYDKHIEIRNTVSAKTIKTDEILLTRILINMAKNALEAINHNETIVVFAKEVNEHIRFGVHNQSFIPKPTQLQIFKRSFSTKGVSRGLGTYSMKLLGEKFLNGKVDFTSSEEKGTTFFIDLQVD